MGVGLGQLGPEGQPPCVGEGEPFGQFGPGVQPAWVGEGEPSGQFGPGVQPPWVGEGEPFGQLGPGAQPPPLCVVCEGMGVALGQFGPGVQPPCVGDGDAPPPGTVCVAPADVVVLGCPVGCGLGEEMDVAVGGVGGVLLSRPLATNTVVTPPTSRMSVVRATRRGVEIGLQRRRIDMGVT